MSLMTKNPLLARFDGQAAFIEPDSLPLVVASLNAIESSHHADKLNEPKYHADENFWGDDDDWFISSVRPYNVSNGVLHIPVKGVLLNAFPYQFFNYATGYEYIRKAFDRGLDDPNVKGIAFIFDTPGGMVAGNFDLCDHIFSNRGIKPLAGFAQESAYSAGYSLISSVDVGSVNISRSGGVGSIGVVTSHFDMSKAMERDGYKVTFIYAGKHKVDGNPYEPLPDDVKQRIQARVDSLYSTFCGIVARNRNMDEQAIRDTEALTFTADEALAVGLADSIGSLEDGLNEFSSSLDKKKDDNMGTANENTNAVNDTALTDAKAAGFAEGEKVGAANERARINTILTSDAATMRPKTAQTLALNEKYCAIDADALVELLNTLPHESASAPLAGGEVMTPKGATGAATDFHSTMDKIEQPNLGAENQTTSPAATRASAALTSIGIKK